MSTTDTIVIGAGQLLAGAVISSGARQRDRTDALADYQATRDRLSVSLFDITDTVATFRWTDDEIGELLIQLSSAMADEVDALVAFDAVVLP